MRYFGEKAGVHCVNSILVLVVVVGAVSLVSFRAYFKEFKTLPHALSLELNNTSTSNLPFENYTGYLLSHGLYSKFCSSLSRLSMDFVQPTCRPSYNNTTRNEAYAHPLNYFLLSLYCELCDIRRTCLFFLRTYIMEQSTEFC